MAAGNTLSGHVDGHYSDRYRHSKVYKASGILIGGSTTLASVAEEKLKYDANGGSGTAPVGSSYVAGSTFTAAANTFTAPAGKQFKGWNTQADGSGTSYAAGESMTMSTSDLTLYAQWVNTFVPTPTPTNVSVDGVQNSNGTSAVIPSYELNQATVANVIINLGGSTITAPASILSNALENGNSLTLTKTVPDAALLSKIEKVALSSGIDTQFIINFNLAATDASGNVTAVYNLSGNVTVTVNLTDAQIAAIGGDTSKAKIYYYYESTGKLTDMNAAFNLTNKTAIFLTNHFSSYMLTLPDKTPPVVSGVENKGIYNTDKTITFDKGTATLDGAAFTSGSTASAEGKHTLVVNDAAGNVTTVIFTIDKTAPAVTGAKNGGIYKTSKIITFSDGSATLDGNAFTSGGAVNEEGTHTLVITDTAGNVTTVIFTIDKTVPKIAVRPVKGGMIVTVTDKNLLSKVVTLNGKKLHDQKTAD